jgi:hypothetical protein
MGRVMDWELNNRAWTSVFSVTVNLVKLHLAVP